jgi:molybdopterin converting factor small subunit
MAKLLLPAVAPRGAGAQGTLTVPGPTVRSVLGALVSDFPAARAQLFDEDGQVRAHIKVFVNGDDIRSLQGQDTVLADRDEVYLVAAPAAGWW